MLSEENAPLSEQTLNCTRYQISAGLKSKVIWNRLFLVRKLLLAIGMDDKQTLRPWQIPHDEAMKRTGKMIEACVLFSKGSITFNQLWSRVRGPKNNSAIQQINNSELGWLLFKLHMDFISWHGARDDIIKQSAIEVARWIRRSESGAA